MCWFRNLCEAHDFTILFLIQKIKEVSNSFISSVILNWRHFVNLDENKVYFIRESASVLSFIVFVLEPKTFNCL